jgi:hypothetical protein
MSDQQQMQFSFKVGGATPDSAHIVLSGRPFAKRDLEKGEELHVQVVDADGVVVADGYGKVIGVQFKDKLDKETGDIVKTERIHQVKIS